MTGASPASFVAYLLREVRMTKASLASYVSPLMLSLAQPEEYFSRDRTCVSCAEKMEECVEGGCLVRSCALHFACPWISVSFGRVAERARRCVR